jgi:predicted TIM-barrel fold metal-dependent hydrolase
MANENHFISRRALLATASLTLTGSVLAESALTESASPYTGQKIDCQSHLYCPKIVELMEKRTDDPKVYLQDNVKIMQMGDWLRKILPFYSDVEAKIAAMDANGITQTAISINDPGPEWFGTQGLEVARIANNYIADLVRRYPTRFFGLCVLPLQDARDAQAELERCHKDLGMKGILLYTNVAGRFVDDADFHWLYAEAENRALPLLLHPGKPLTTEIVKDYEMTSSLGNMFDDTIALTRIIMSGLLDRHPDLKLVCPHLGGTLPYMIGRIDHQTQVLKRGPRYLKHKPSDYLKRVWFDIVSPLPLAIRFCYDLPGVDRLIYSSDHPWVDPSVISDALLSLRLPSEDVKKIFYQNAQRLFGLT